MKPLCTICQFNYNRSKFYILLTVHHIMILGKWPKWRTNSFPCIYIFIFLTLYMFRAHRAHHQERQTVSIQPLVVINKNKYIERNLYVTLVIYQESFFFSPYPSSRTPWNLSLCVREPQVKNGWVAMAASCVTLVFESYRVRCIL